MTYRHFVKGGREQYLGLFQVYASSEYGMHHQQQPLRYEAAFGSYGREEMLLDLGADIDPLGHMPATEETFTHLTADERQVSSMDVHTGRLTAVLHDLGECTHPRLIEKFGAVVGDVPQGSKTDEQRAIEARIWDMLMDRYYQDRLGSSQIERIRKIVTHQEDSWVHSALEAAHDTNTLRVGLCAGKLALTALEQGKTGRRLACLSNIGKVVSREIILRMERHAKLFAYPGNTLDKAEPLYQRIQNEL
jgi:hypothetical protein